MRLIVGLGNPGKRYRLSRHNLGFWTVDQLARIHHAKVFLPRFQGRVSRIKLGEEKIVLLKPYTYMNLSGISVASALRKLGLASEELIVIHDDLDLALGQLKIGFGLRSAGHNGVESIIEHLGTKEFYRVRLGIGKPGQRPEPEEVVEYVLSNFREEEREKVGQMIEDACRAIEILITQGMAQAQNLFHRKS